uniref:Uncharacterized protein n=1 Tax=Anopheles maculatus TaxID=74869 RepID=A0A182SND8_9DIPT
MALPAQLNFTNNIRTHATFVGVIVALDAICTLLLSAEWNINADKLPKDRTLRGRAERLSLMDRQRWCLTLFIGYLAVAITLQFIGFLGAILQLQIVSACALLIVLAINGYVLLVTLQLRKANANFSLPHDGLGV